MAQSGSALGAQRRGPVQLVRRPHKDLQAAIEAVTDEDAANRRFIRADLPDFSPLLPQELDIYREALLIFYAKASIYLRAMGRELPGDWPAWIG